MTPSRYPFLKKYSLRPTFSLRRGCSGWGEELIAHGAALLQRLRSSALLGQGPLPIADLADLPSIPKPAPNASYRFCQFDMDGLPITWPHGQSITVRLVELHLAIDLAP